MTEKQKAGIKRVGKDLSKAAQDGKRMVDKVQFPPKARGKKK